MLYAIPQLAETLRITPVDTADNTPGQSYHLSREGDDGHVALSAVAIGMLMFADGRSTIENIYQRARRMQLSPPDGFLEQLFDALFKAGFAKAVPAATLTHHVLPGTEHVCEGCGRSCEGHLIGPLPADEARTIADLFGDLCDKVPRLRGKQFIGTFPDQQGIYLNLIDGRCVFLGEDRRCELHRHFGAESKPSICRSFPYMRVYTEQGIRVGVNNACFRHHQHMARITGDPDVPVDLAGDLASLPAITRDATPFLVHPLQIPSHQMVRDALAYVTLEQRLIHTLGEPSCTLAHVAALLLDKSPPTASPQSSRVLSSSVMRHAHRVLKKLNKSIDPRETFVGFLATRDEGRLSQSYRGLLDDIKRFARKPVPKLKLTFTREQEDFLIDHIRRLIWLRESLNFESMVHAVATLYLGWAWTLWRIRPVPPHARFDALGEGFTAWFRVMTEDDLHETLFAHVNDARTLLATMLPTTKR